MFVCLFVRVIARVLFAYEKLCHRINETNNGTYD